MTNEEAAEYRVWAGMKTRCYNPNSNSYFRYGARGIEMTQEWRTSFAAFVRDMGPRPSMQHQIDRIDNSKGYCEENCRWATVSEQARNRRTNRRITFRGITQCLEDWGEQTGLQPLTIRYRLEHGWSIEKALTTPVPSLT
jgi:hypothetical protein